MEYNDVRGLHTPVMLRQVLEMLEVKSGGTYADCTTGMGGHAEAVLGLIGPDGRLFCLDRDAEALLMARKRLSDDPRCSFIKSEFSNIGAALSGIEADGMLMDLGVSMYQLKADKRGFSFHSEEEPDMRMDSSAPVKASDVLNTYSEEDLINILRKYGEERLAPRIAREIIRRRPIRTCREVAQITERAYRRSWGRPHPATRTFQALRIEVNAELEELSKGLEAGLGVLKQGGRMAVISYHSLEDRIVKNFMREKAKEGSVKILTKKPIVPEASETQDNPASRSAKLRAGEKA